MVITSRAGGDHGREERKVDKMRSNMPIVDTSCAPRIIMEVGNTPGAGATYPDLRHATFTRILHTMRTELRLNTEGLDITSSPTTIKEGRIAHYVCDVRPLHIVIKIQDNRLW